MTKDQALRKVLIAHKSRADLRRKGHAQLAAAIQDAIAAGASIREIGRELRISHVAVSKILRSKPE